VPSRVHSSLAIARALGPQHGHRARPRRLPEKRNVLWNVIPPCVSTIDKNQNATAAQIRAAAPDTQAFIDKLKTLRVVILRDRKHNWQSPTYGCRRAYNCWRRSDRPVGGYALSLTEKTSDRPSKRVHPHHCLPGQRHRGVGWRISCRSGRARVVMTVGVPAHSSGHIEMDPGLGPRP
jgi:hypothetical protein